MESIMTRRIMTVLLAITAAACAVFAGCTQDISTESEDSGAIVETEDTETRPETVPETEAETEPEPVYEIKTDPSSGICFIAHRGYSGKFHENTDEAFIEAVNAGFGGIETDVRITKDGVFVVNHDSDVVYADGTSLIIADHTYEELTAKPIKNSKTDSELYLCSFERYLEICRDGGIICVVELKGAFSEEQVVEVFNMCEEIYTLKMCQIQSFNFDNLLFAHENFPDLTIVYTCEDKNDSNIASCLEYGFNIAIDYEEMTQDMIDAFHEKGLVYDIWTLNSKNALKYCTKFNVDFIESDYFTTVDVINQ